jgi:tetratricopeptide (TPR) repeat protein
MIKNIKVLINSLKSAWHSGKGDKCIRLKYYKKALYHYKLAFELSDPNDNRAVLKECIARTLIRLGHYQDALTFAEQSYREYKESIHCSKHIQSSYINRIVAEAR